jgi:hypothetical protein
VIAPRVLLAIAGASWALRPQSRVLGSVLGEHAVAAGGVPEHAVVR